MKTAVRVAAFAVVLLLAPSCARAVGGEARPAPGLVPTPLTGEKVKQVLLGEADVTKILHQTMESDPESPPRFGGADQLGTNWAAATPAECAGVVGLMQQNTYRGAAVQATAVQSWLDPGGDDKAAVVLAFDGAVSLPTASAATKLFQTFAEQWSRCEVVTVIRSNPDSKLTGEITEVENDGSVISAIIEATINDGATIMGRALGVRANCIVETTVLYHTRYEPDNFLAAIDIARAMMGKVGDLS